MSTPGKSHRKPLIDARPATAATLFVCSECDRGAECRRDLRDALKKAGRKRELRIVACRCLDVCPKRATAMVLARTDEQTRCIVVDDAAGPAEVLAELLT